MGEKKSLKRFKFQFNFRASVFEGGKYTIFSGYYYFQASEKKYQTTGVGKGNEILKIENSLHLKAVRKTSPWFPAAAKAARAHFNGNQ